MQKTSPQSSQYAQSFPQLQIVGQTSTPFGIRSGGHTTNPGFSSTQGVQIALFQLSEITYHAGPPAADGSVGTVDIGSGLIWDDVYAALEPYNVTVVGGRATGIGVGGFILGGGYSWLSNQYGLAIDNVVAFEVVLPNGTITTATETTNPDLFFGLKGGFNNFGVVTKFTLLAYPQTQVWGGVQTYSSEHLSDVNAATLDFIANVTDPKAAIILSPYASIITSTLAGLQTSMSLLMFYDGPNPPAGIFERYTNISNTSADVSTRSMSSLVRANPANGTSGFRSAHFVLLVSTFNTVSLKNYSSALLDQIVNQTTYWGDQAPSNLGFLISYSIEPFLPSMSTRSKGGAYPHDDFLVPLNLDWSWALEVDDGFFINGAKQSAQVILDQAIAEGQDIAGDKQIKYGNYSPADEDLKSIYGANLDRLRSIKQQYDPNNIMSLAGGYRFQPLNMALA
ncbi:hypothetical protein FRC07_003062 [Ceratobasidium sp. 392]|nr:hypothetical protein FRC07_003062 [Ceratobasidium sp. 392]